jgi:hypothetical protein
MSSTVGGLVGQYACVTNQQANPSKLIEGMLLKYGLVRPADGLVRPAEGVTPSPERTLQVRLGISGKRNVGMGGYTQEVTISLLIVSPASLCLHVRRKALAARQPEISVLQLSVV